MTPDMENPMNTEAIEILADGVPTWEYPDGTRLPIIRGGDGEGDAPAPEGEPASEPSGAPEAGSEGAPAPEDTPPAEPLSLEQQLEAWGGMEGVTDAIAIRDALQTEEGVTQLFFEAGRSLGYGIREIQSFVDGTQPIPEELGGDGPNKGDDPDAPDPDEVLTRAQVEALIQEKAVKPLEADKAEALAATQQQAVKNVLDVELKIEDPDARASILQLGQKYLSDTDEDPEVLAEAVRRGHADFNVLVEKQAKLYRDGKQQQRDSTPVPVTGGGSVGGGEAGEALTFDKFGKGVLKEAMRRARERAGSE